MLFLVLATTQISAENCTSFTHAKPCYRSGCKWISAPYAACLKMSGIIQKRFGEDAYTMLATYLPSHSAVLPVGLSWKDMRRLPPHRRRLTPFQTLPPPFSKLLSEHRSKAFIFGTVESRLWKNHHTVQCEASLPPRWDTLDDANNPVKALDVVTMEPIYHSEGQCNVTAAAYAHEKHRSDGPSVAAKDPTSCYTLSPGSTSISVPYPTAFQASSTTAMAEHQAYTVSNTRDILVSYAGGSHGLHSGLRRGILEWCAESSDSECKVHDCTQKGDCVNNFAILATYARSVFCLQPDGDTPTRQGWFDALLSGCIPVFFSTCLRPNLFYERVYAPFLPAYNRTAYGPGDWAVVVNASAPISLLASTLRRIDADTVRRMQRRIVDISPGIQYSTVPGAVQNDAQTIYSKLLDRKYQTPATS